MDKHERLKTYEGKDVEVSVTGRQEVISGNLDFVGGGEITVKEESMVRGKEKMLDSTTSHHIQIDDVNTISSTGVEEETSVKKENTD